MKFRGETERAIYAAAYALRLEAGLSSGYPHAWREADRTAGRAEGEAFRIAEWEAWCTDLAIESGQTAVEVHRQAMRRRR